MTILIKVGILWAETESKCNLLVKSILNFANPVMTQSQLVILYVVHFYKKTQKALIRMMRKSMLYKETEVNGDFLEF